MRFPILINWTSLFPFQGLLGGIFFISIKISTEHSVSKQWRPWSDAAYCGVWSGTTLSARVPQKGSYAYMVKSLHAWKLSSSLALLSRRLMGELIVHQWLSRPSAVRSPSVVKYLLWIHWANWARISKLGQGQVSLFKWSL